LPTPMPLPWLKPAAVMMRPLLLKIVTGPEL
jgi:hypothetical protein